MDSPLREALKAFSWLIKFAVNPKAYAAKQREAIAQVQRAAQEQAAQRAVKRESYSRNEPMELDAETQSWFNKLAPLWQQIRAFEHAADIGPFEPGYAPRQLAELEQAAGFALPPELRAHYLIHAWVGCTWDNITFAELESIAERCRNLNEALAIDSEMTLSPGVRAPHFGAKLIPLNEDDPAICIDLDPGEGGIRGQIVEIDFEGGTCKVLARDLAGFLRHGIARLATPNEDD